MSVHFVVEGVTGEEIMVYEKADKLTLVIELGGSEPDICFLKREDPIEVVKIALKLLQISRNSMSYAEWLEVRKLFDEVK